MITLTPTAIEHLMHQPSIVRLVMDGGGCAGYTYRWCLSSKTQDDFVVNDCLVIDSISILYLAGSTINFITDISGGRLVIENPAAKGTCGCGKSVSIGEL
jgi:iron-sulfur cluster assembly accessory protein